MSSLSGSMVTVRTVRSKDFYGKFGIAGCVLPLPWLSVFDNESDQNQVFCVFSPLRRPLSQYDAVSAWTLTSSRSLGKKTTRKANNTSENSPVLPGQCNT